MTGSMYAAIAGLKTHMQNLNVIGNNVANVNTNGYKASRAVFKTSLYTSLSGGSDGTTIMGGTNPSQVGYGSTVSSVDVDMSTGNYAVTGKSTDLMLDGDGFFLVGSKDIAQNFDGTATDVNKLTALTLTRVGDFEFRADGYLGKNDGNVVYGFLCVGYYGDANHPIGDGTNGTFVLPAGKKEGEAIFSDQLVPIRFPRLENAYYDDKTGKRATAADALNAADGTLKEGYSLGKAIAYPSQQIKGANGAGEASPTGHLYDAGYNFDAETSELTMGRFQGISFDSNTGLITATSKDTEEVVTIGCLAIGSVTNPNGVTNMGDNYYKAAEGSGELTIAIAGGNAKSMGIEQINKSLQAADEEKAIDALSAYSTSTKVLSNGLEMSKTDLAQEIANMILTQRGYQANTRIVTVTDSMLEELVNMKR